jgi:hypothetical protein
MVKINVGFLLLVEMMMWPAAEQILWADLLGKKKI